MEKEKIKKTDQNGKDQKNDKTEEDNIKKEEEKETSPEDNIKKEEEKETSPEEKIKDLEDKLTRTLAEMENQRRRFEKEKEDAFEYGGFAFAREALNLIDNLERSKISLENDNSLKNTEALKKILEHLDIINKDMISILKKNNIEPIKSINEKLDSNLHQTMMEIEDDSKEPGTIVQEIQKGFLMKDRLLRPSLVGVSKKTQKNDEENRKDQENKEKNDKN
jgi:molecular chaperone GrpE